MTGNPRFYVGGFSFCFWDKTSRGRLSKKYGMYGSIKIYSYKWNLAFIQNTEHEHSTQNIPDSLTLQPQSRGITWNERYFQIPKVCLSTGHSSAITQLCWLWFQSRFLVLSCCAELQGHSSQGRLSLLLPVTQFYHYSRNCIYVIHLPFKTNFILRTINCR